MFASFRALIQRSLTTPVPATGLALFRILFGLVALQEIGFLGYFRHLIFDPVPFVDPASGLLPLFLAAWGIAAGCLTVGYHTRLAAIVNYALWLIFIGFTPLWQDFDGGFDQLMIGSSFLLIFLPSERALSLDRLRYALSHSTLRERRGLPQTVPALAYHLPVIVSLGFIYFDSAVHKLSAEFWRNGLGAWLPPTHPYYTSPWDTAWLLNQQLAEQIIGYAILAFQFLFLPLYAVKPLRWLLIILGGALHVGIIVSMNVYPFGFAMLIHYVLLVPPVYWNRIGAAIRVRQPRLTVFYDGECRLCARTAIVIDHFDVRGAIAFNDLQTHAAQYPQLSKISTADLLKDLYVLDRKNRVYSGVDSYIRIWWHLGYTAWIGWLLQLPVIYHYARDRYRGIADTRQRLLCDADCLVSPQHAARADLSEQFLAPLIGVPAHQPNRLTKCLVILAVLQLNSTVHYGILYRLGINAGNHPLFSAVETLSNGVLFLSSTLLGITPHALYLHDHFQHYTRILALTYKDDAGAEHWLPFVNPDGRLATPNWGRVQSFWANVSVTPHPVEARLTKALIRTTAFWGSRYGVDLNDAEFVVKMKDVQVPVRWEPGLRARNLAGEWRDVGRVVWLRQTPRVALAPHELPLR